MKIGYARVSTLDQNPDLQRDELEKAGCEEVVVDRNSFPVLHAHEPILAGEDAAIDRLEAFFNQIPQLLLLQTLECCVDPLRSPDRTDRSRPSLTVRRGARTVNSVISNPWYFIQQRCVTVQCDP
jgi:hypothetical protein